MRDLRTHRSMVMLAVVLLGGATLQACKRDKSAERQLIEAVVERVGGRGALTKARANMKVGAALGGEPTSVKSVVDAARGQAMRGVAIGRPETRRWRFDRIGPKGTWRVSRTCPRQPTKKSLPAAEARLLKTELIDLEPPQLLSWLLSTTLRSAPKAAVLAGQRAIAFELPSGEPAVAILDVGRKLLVEVRYGQELGRRIGFSRWRFYDGVLYPNEVVFTAAGPGGSPLRVRWREVSFVARATLKRAYADTESHCRHGMGTFSELGRLLLLSQIHREPVAVDVHPPSAAELPAFLASVAKRAGGAAAIRAIRSLRWRGHLPNHSTYRMFCQLRGDEARRSFADSAGTTTLSLTSDKYRMQHSGDVRPVVRDADDEAGIDALIELVYGDPLRLLGHMLTPAAKPRLAAKATVKAGQLAVDITLPHQTVVTLVFDLRARLLIEYHGRYGHVGDNGKKQTTRVVAFRDWTVMPSGVLYPLRWRYQALRPIHEGVQTVVIDKLELAPSSEKDALGRKPCVGAPRVGCRWP